MDSTVAGLIPADAELVRVVAKLDRTSILLCSQLRQSFFHQTKSKSRTNGVGRFGLVTAEKSFSIFLIPWKFGSN